MMRVPARRLSVVFVLTAVLTLVIGSCELVPRETFAVSYELTMDENIDLISLEYRNSEGERVDVRPSAGERAGSEGWDAEGETWTVASDGFADDATAALVVRPRDTADAERADLAASIVVDDSTEREYSFAREVDGEGDETRGEGIVLEDGRLELTLYLRRVRWRP